MNLPMFGKSVLRLDEFVENVRILRQVDSTGFTGFPRFGWDVRKPRQVDSTGFTGFRCFWWRLVETLHRIYRFPAFLV